MLSQEIGRRGPVVVPIGQALRMKGPTGPRHQTEPVHQARHVHVTATLTVSLQSVRDARASVGLAAFLVGLSDQWQQGGIGLRSRARSPSCPGRITTATWRFGDHGQGFF